jgi:hypothetical protein
MKGQIDMLFTPKPQHKKILLGILGIALLAGIVILLSTKTKNDTQIPLSDKSPSLEELRQEVDRIAKYEFEHGCLEKNERGQNVFCGESKQKVDAAEARYNAALKASTMPDPSVQQSDLNAIRNFMGDQSMTLEYSRSQSPANFDVGVLTKLSDQGDEKIEKPDAWKRTVNIYRATKEIENTCQVYEYEVYPKTHELIEVRVIYPDTYQGQCAQKGSLFAPPASTESEIKTNGEAYLRRANPKTDDEYTVTQVNASRLEWKWQDTAYKLPAGLSGRSAVDSKPTVRLYISNAGKLLQYNNTIPLFEN